MLNKPGIHGRDHCPGGADPIPCLSSGGSPEWAYLSNIPDSPTVVGAGSALNITFSEYWTTDTDAAVFSFTPSPVGSGQQLNVLAPGLYIYDCRVLANSTSVTKNLAVDLEGSLPARWNAVPWYDPNNWNTSIAPDGISPWTHDEILQTYLSPSDFPFSWYVRIHVHNYEAFDIEIQNAYLEVAYWSATKDMVQIV